MAQGQGAVTIVAALIIGASIAGGSYAIRTAIDGASVEIAALRDAFEGAVSPQRGRDAERTRGPDPRRRYSVNTAGAPVRGNEDAKLTIVEFSDFQCPYCRHVEPTLQQIQAQYGDKVKIVFKHLPLVIHPKAPDAHAAAEAAHRQGKFWEMHDKIFANQQQMSVEKYREFAGELGLDVAQFDRDRSDPEVLHRVEADAAEASALGVTGTPGFFINGRFLSGSQPFANFQALIDEELGKG